MFAGADAWPRQRGAKSWVPLPRSRRTRLVAVGAVLPGRHRFGQLPTRTFIGRANPSCSLLDPPAKRTQNESPYMNDRKRFTGVTLTALVSASLLLLPRSATASSLDIGAAAGVVKRSLSDTDYKMGFTWQLSADLAMLPILTIGPYLTFAN